MPLLRLKMSAFRTDLLAAWNSATFQAIYGNSLNRLSRMRVPNSSLRRRLLIDSTKVNFKCSFGYKAPLSGYLFQEGEWDVRRRPIEEIMASDVRYQTCREIVLDAVPVHETTEYQELLKRLRHRGRARSFATEREIASYLNKVADMYRTIQQERKIQTSEERGLSRHGGDIEVAIGSDEELLVSAGGNHRFAIAHVLELSTPVQVGAIHKDLIPKIRHDYSSSGGATEAVNRYLHDVQLRYQ